MSIGGEILKEEGASVGGKDVAIGSVAKHLMPLEMESARYPFSFLSGEPHAAYPDGVAHSGVGHFPPPLLARPPADYLLDDQAIYAQKWGWGAGSIVVTLLLLIFTTGSLLGIVLVPVLIVAVAVGAYWDVLPQG